MGGAAGGEETGGLGISGFVGVLGVGVADEVEVCDEEQLVVVVIVAVTVTIEVIGFFGSSGFFGGSSGFFGGCSGIFGGMAGGDEVGGFSGDTGVSPPGGPYDGGA